MTSKGPFQPKASWGTWSEHGNIYRLLRGTCLCTLIFSEAATADTVQLLYLQPAPFLGVSYLNPVKLFLTYTEIKEASEAVTRRNAVERNGILPSVLHSRAPLQPETELTLITFSPDIQVPLYHTEKTNKT